MMRWCKHLAHQSSLTQALILSESLLERRSSNKIKISKLKDSRPLVSTSTINLLSQTRCKRISMSLTPDCLKLNRQDQSLKIKMILSTKSINQKSLKSYNNAKAERMICKNHAKKSSIKCKESANKERLKCKESAKREKILWRDNVKKEKILFPESARTEKTNFINSFNNYKMRIHH